MLNCTLPREEAVDMLVDGCSVVKSGSGGVVPVCEEETMRRKAIER